MMALCSRVATWACIALLSGRYTDARHRGTEPPWLRSSARAWDPHRHCPHTSRRVLVVARLHLLLERSRVESICNQLILTFKNRLRRSIYSICLCLVHARFQDVSRSALFPVYPYAQTYPKAYSYSRADARAASRQ